MQRRDRLLSSTLEAPYENVLLMTEMINFISIDRMNL